MNKKDITLANPVPVKLPKDIDDRIKILADKTKLAKSDIYRIGLINSIDDLETRINGLLSSNDTITQEIDASDQERPGTAHIVPQ